MLNLITEALWLNKSKFSIKNYGLERNKNFTCFKYHIYIYIMFVSKGDNFSFTIKFSYMYRVVIIRVECYGKNGNDLF